MSELDVALLRDAYDALNHRDSAGALAALAPDAEWHESEELPGGGVFRGRDAIAAFLHDFLEHWEEFRQEIEDVVVCGEKIGVFLRSTTRVRGSDATVTARYAHVWTMRDGAGVHVQAIYDPDEARRLLSE